MNEKAYLNLLELSLPCEICRDIFTGSMRNSDLGAKIRPPFNVAQTVEELVLSTHRGCHLCYLRWEQLAPRERINGFGSPIIYYFYNETAVIGLVFYYFPMNWARALIKEFGTFSNGSIYL
jgi:hypothetical protein